MSEEILPCPNCKHHLTGDEKILYDIMGECALRDCSSIRAWQNQILSKDPKEYKKYMDLHNGDYSWHDLCVLVVKFQEEAYELRKELEQLTKKEYYYE